MNTDTAIRLLTIITLSGLLFSIGLQLTWRELADALRKNRVPRIVLANFILVPALGLFLIRTLEVQSVVAVGILILAAAPFAPVVPTFARLAKADLALAGALTALFPFLSSFITPLICKLTLIPPQGGFEFDAGLILVTLVSTITLPLAAGVALRHWYPAPGRRLLKSVQTLSEATGAFALAFITATEFQTIRSTGWRSLVATGLLSELSFVIGYVLGGPTRAARFVAAVGTSNRNIALALLIAVQSFSGTAIVASVVANGLLMILLGLVHVGLWRLLVSRRNNA